MNPDLKPKLTHNEHFIQGLVEIISEYHSLQETGKIVLNSTKSLEELEYKLEAILTLITRETLSEDERLKTSSYLEKLISNEQIPESFRIIIEACLNELKSRVIKG